MSSEKDFFGRLNQSGYQARRGQAELWRIVSTIIKAVYIFIWPTGYGKSDGGLGAYDICRQQLRVDRLLITVPTTTQADQYIAGLEQAARSLGMALRSYQDPKSGHLQVARLIDGSATDLRLAFENQCEIFVVTIQMALSNEGHLLDLMNKGRWMVWHDEYHRLNVSESAKFGQVARRLGGSVVLGCTATPHRTDRRPTIFDAIDPDSIVTWKSAYDEQAIRGVAAHIEHYTLHVEDREGNEFTLTTEDLAGETSYEDYEYRRDLRYKDDYLADILGRAARTLATKNLAHPGQHQMLVFAMSLRHAREHVVKSLNEYYGEGFADYVGTDRDDVTNRTVFKRYEANTLPCLVQVNKATEGFNNKRASVLVFLTLLHKRTVRTQQGAGRGVRRNYAIPFNRDIADMFCSPDSEIAEHLKELALLTTGEIQGPDDDDDDDLTNGANGAVRGVRVIELPALSNSILDAIHDHSDHYYPTDAEIDEARIKLHDDPQTAAGEFSDEQLERVLRGMHRRDETQRTEQRRAAADLLTKTNVELAVRTLAGNVAAVRLGERDSSAWTELRNKLCHHINSGWRYLGGKPANQSLYEDLKAKYLWLDEINKQMAETGMVPPWLASVH
jgi:superfamily II DNA or RNA helicase